MFAKAAEVLRKLFDGLKAGVEALVPGMNRFFSEVGATVEQKLDQGSSELANSLFHESNAFVLYGPGQNPKLFDRGHDQQHEQGRELELSHER